jgi:hypothetical protein
MIFSPNTTFAMIIGYKIFYVIRKKSKLTKTRMKLSKKMNGWCNYIPTDTVGGIAG